MIKLNSSSRLKLSFIPMLMLLLAAFVSAFVIVAPSTPMVLASSPVQTATSTSTFSRVSSYILNATFGSSTTSSDVLVAAFEYLGVIPVSVSGFDSQGNTLSFVGGGSYELGGGYTLSTWMAVTTTTQSAPDKLSIEMTGSRLTGTVALQIIEVSGVVTHGLTSSYDSGYATTSLNCGSGVSGYWTFSTMAAAVSYSSPSASLSAGTGFTLLTSSGVSWGGVEYSDTINTVSSPTTCPATITTSGNASWSANGLGLLPTTYIPQTTTQTQTTTQSTTTTRSMTISQTTTQTETIQPTTTTTTTTSTTTTAPISAYALLTATVIVILIVAAGAAWVLRGRRS